MLIAILNNQIDFSIARDRHWYRIPVRSVEKWLRDRWPPIWISFYQTKVFGQNAHSINYYARVLKIWKAHRWQLFPERPLDNKSDRLYYQLLIEPLKKLPKPIYSRRWRRIIFIQTTWDKFINAIEINDLFDGSRLEDKLWAEFKRLEIPAERQKLVKVKKKNYFLDFAIYCAKGNLNIETDGDKWHHNPKIAPIDNLRNNDLVSVGWQILRFTKNQIYDQISEYCIPKIISKVNSLGGVAIDKNKYRKVDYTISDGSNQYGLL